MAGDQQYRDNWERIFGKKEPVRSPDGVDLSQKNNGQCRYADSFGRGGARMPADNKCPTCRGWIAKEPEPSVDPSSPYRERKVER